MEFNIAALHEAIAGEIPDRECIVFRDRRLTWAAVTDRTRRLAGVLAAAGLGLVADPSAVEPWVSPHDHLALYLHNGNEYLEGMLGAFKARMAPFNVNYRYVAEELAYVLGDAGARAVIYHASFAPVLADVLPTLGTAPLLLQVDDRSGEPLLDGAVDYEVALAAADPGLAPGLADSWSPDDRYVLYTGGTTGMPKGVLWRQGDFLPAALGFRRRDGREFSSTDQVVDAARTGRLRALPAAPFMHGAAHWNALSAWLTGGTVVVQGEPGHLDPVDIFATCERERATSLLIVGDAFARPLADELRAGSYDLSALRFILTGGAILSTSTKADLLELVPGVTIVDILGSSESGRQGITSTTTASSSPAGRFDPTPSAAIVSADMTRVLALDDHEEGWLAQGGRVPLGYLGDPDKTAATFPIIEGRRYAVPGDRARYDEEGRIELYGRESVTINSGGEKIFAEEVEHALKAHPDVFDAVVVGRPSERWGNEVVALVRLRDGAEVTDVALLAECGRHVARYKHPKAILRLDHIERSPSGKADYRWARAVAIDDAGEGPPR